jgi:hypothetical protein
LENLNKVDTINLKATSRKQLESKKNKLTEEIKSKEENDFEP